MSTTINSLNSSTAFDFTKMTRGQAVVAASTLRREGKISGDEAAVLDGFACSYAPGPDGEGAADVYSPSDPREFNFMDMIYKASLADTGEPLAERNDQALLRHLAPLSTQGSKPAE